MPHLIGCATYGWNKRGVSSSAIPAPWLCTVTSTSFLFRFSVTVMGVFGVKLFDGISNWIHLRELRSN